MDRTAQQSENGVSTGLGSWSDIILIFVYLFQEVVDFCKSYLDVNKEAFSDPRLQLIINDARAELQNTKDWFDIIIGDLADPIEGGPCYQLYTKSFYESIVKPRLSEDGCCVSNQCLTDLFASMIYKC